MKLMRRPFGSASRSFVFLAVIALLLILIGSAFAQLTETDVLVSLAEKSVRQNLEASAKAAADLELAVKGLCSTPDAANLKLARQEWKKAYLAWNKSAPFVLGSMAKAEKKINKWPANGVVIDAAVRADDLGHLLKNSDTRGFPGAEHLLFTPTDAKSATAAGRCPHLLSVTEEIAQLTAGIGADWVNDKSEPFKKAGDGDPFLVPGDALSLVLAKILNVTEVLLRDRIAVPSNFFEDPSRPDYLDAWESKTTRDGIKASVAGIRQALVGNGQSGIIRLVATKDGLYESKDPKLARDIEDQLDTIDKTLSKLGGSDLDLHKAVKEKPSTLKKLYKQLNELQEQVVEAALVLEVDVRSGLEVQLTQ